MTVVHGRDGHHKWARAQIADRGVCWLIVSGVLTSTLMQVIVKVLGNLRHEEEVLEKVVWQ